MNIIKVIQSTGTWLPRTHIWMYNQLLYLPDGIESHIVCENTVNMDEFSLPNIHFPKNRNIFNIYWSKAIKKLGFRKCSILLMKVGQDNEFHILHSHNGHQGWYDIDAARKLKTKHVVAFYGLDANLKDKIWRKRYRELFDVADLVLCEGQFFARTLAKLGCSENKIRVHHLGVPTESIKYELRTWDGKQPLRILIAARFTEKKGIPYALEAVGRLKSKLPVQVTIIGDAVNLSNEQKEKRKIIEVIDKHKLRANVRFLGYQPYSTVLSEAYKHHIFMSPSVTAENGDSEGGAPIALIDMAASGISIVSSRHCDIPEIIKDRETGLLCDERNIDQLEESLMWYIEHRDRWRELSDAGRKHIELEYDARIQSARLSTLYSDLNCLTKSINHT